MNLTLVYIIKFLFKASLRSLEWALFTQLSIIDNGWKDVQLGCNWVLEDKTGLERNSFPHGEESASHPSMCLSPSHPQLRML